MNYTKGKWKVKGQRPQFKIVAGKITVATIISTSGAPIDEKEANAHLIAAAPEIYEALKAFVDESRGTDRFSSDIITDAICVLRKAENR